MPTEFLMEQMQLREQLDEVDSKDDPMALLEKLIQSVDEKKSARIQQLSASFTQQDFKRARNSVRELQFLQKIAEEMELAEDRLL